MASRSIVYIIYVYMYIYIHARSIVYTLPCVNSNIMYILYIGLKEGKEGNGCQWVSYLSGRSSTAHARGLRVDSCLHQLSFFSLAIWKVTAQITSEYIISNGLYTRRVYQQSDFSCFDFAQDCFLCNAMFHVTSCSPCIVLSTLG